MEISKRIFQYKTIVLVFLVCFSCQQKKEPTMNLSTDKEVHTANYYVNYNVINKNDENIKAIIDRWQEYLKAEDQIGYNNEYWTSDNQVCPSCIMRLIPLNNFKKGGTQNTVIGVLPVEENIWELTSLFSYNQGGMVQPHFVLKIYVKKIESEYKFINKVDYVKQKLLSSKVGNLTYYYDCDHDFNEKKAIQLNEFNNYLSNFFDTPAIDFDYFVCSSVRDISKLKGFEFEPSMYVPNQTGAIVDNINKIIYAGNSSEYYPHEVVHLYTKELFNYSYHTWIDEGLATMLGGSREKLF